MHTPKNICVYVYVYVINIEYLPRLMATLNMTDTDFTFIAKFTTKIFKSESSNPNYREYHMEKQQKS